MFRNGRWLGFGLLPGLVALALYAAALVGLLYGADDFVRWATPFASDWSSGWLKVFRGFLTAVVVSLGLFISVITFTAVTLLVGQPFYESLSEQVDRTEGGEVPESGRSFWEDLWISARDSVRLLVRVVLYGILLFALGFIPVIGQTVVPAIGFCVSGFFLTQELTSVALQRRRVDLAEQLVLLRGRRAQALGFGVPLVLAFLIPFVAVFLMPGAVAGATLMARELVGADSSEGGPRTRARTRPAATVPAGSSTDRHRRARGRTGSSTGSPRARARTASRPRPPTARRPRVRPPTRTRRARTPTASRTARPPTPTARADRG